MTACEEKEINRQASISTNVRGVYVGDSFTFTSAYFASLYDEM